MISIVFPGNSLGDLRAGLLDASPNEAAALILAAPSNTGQVKRLLVREWHIVPSNECDMQEPMRVSISPSFTARYLKRARIEGWSLLFVHTHPFADDHVEFSLVDDNAEKRLMPLLFSRAASRIHGSMVLGVRSVAARVWETPSQVSPVDAVVEVGPNQNVHRRRSASAEDIPYEFDRSVRAFGVAGQRAIASLSVAIVGLGGLGSIVAEQLAHLGVRRFILIDPDVVEATNLNRVVGTSLGDIGKAKVDVASALVRRIRPNISVDARCGDVVIADHARSLLSADFIFSCTDSHGSRAVLNQMAYQYYVPIIDMGVRIDAADDLIHNISGRVQMLAPSLPCLVCQNLLDPETVRRELLTPEGRAADPYIAGAATPIVQPAVISLNGTVASLGVTMMLSAVTGIPVASRHQIVLFDRGITRSVTSSVATDCVVCSMRGALGRGDTWALPGRPC